jgi:hypothetical protein
MLSERSPKRIVCGRLDRYGFYEEKTFPSEHDWNLLLDPTPDYRDALTVVDGPLLRFRKECAQPDAPVKEVLSKRCLDFTPRVVNTSIAIFGKKIPIDGWQSVRAHPSKCNPSTGEKCIIEAEVTAPKALREVVKGLFSEKRTRPQEPALPGGQRETLPETEPDFHSPLLDQNVCVYGPWVAEVLHFHRPEIHPTEAIWWRHPASGDAAKGMTWEALSLLDASGRFDNSMLIDGKRPPYVGPLLPTCPEGRAPRSDEACGVPPHDILQPWVLPFLAGRYSMAVHVPEGAQYVLGVKVKHSDGLVPGASHPVRIAGQTGLEVRPPEGFSATIQSACRAKAGLRAWVDLDFRIESSAWRKELLDPTVEQTVRDGHVWLLMSLGPETSAQQPHTMNLAAPASSSVQELR